MMATEESIPVIDFQEFLSSDNWSDSGAIHELHKAFSRIGFVFLVNHGIEMNLVRLAKSQ